MAGSGPGYGYGVSANVSSVTVEFMRKAAFLQLHPEWTIDYSAESSAYVAVRKNGHGGQWVIVELTMKALMDRLEEVVVSEPPE
jgi:hypothetical protein